MTEQTITLRTFKAATDKLLFALDRAAQKLDARFGADAGEHVRRAAAEVEKIAGEVFRKHS